MGVLYNGHTLIMGRCDDGNTRAGEAMTLDRSTKLFLFL